MPKNQSFRFAADTSVPEEKTRMEIDRLLRKAGANALGFLSTETYAEIAFVMRGRKIRMRLSLTADVSRTPEGRRRSESALATAQEKETRRRWRCLLLSLKAKLAAVEGGVSSFEDEFLAWTILPGGGTVGDATRARIAEAYRSGANVPLLGAP